MRVLLGVQQHGAIEGAVCAKTGSAARPAVRATARRLRGSRGRARVQRGLMDRAFQYVKDAGGICREGGLPLQGPGPVQPVQGTRGQSQGLHESPRRG